MMKEDTDVKLMMSSLRTQCREKESQCDQLQHYNSDLTAKVSYNNVSGRIIPVISLYCFDIRVSICFICD